MLDPKRIWSSSQLPTLPGVAIKLLELAKNPDTEIRHVIETISIDPAIAAKILKAANSSFFGLSSEVRTLDRAVPLLGTTVSTSLALSFSLTDDAMSRGPVAEHYLAYWRQSIVQACAAEYLGARQNRAHAGEFFLCGLLLDLGRLAMLKTIARQYVPVLEAVQTELQPLIDGERNALGFDHVEIGTKLMEHWKLPSVMVEAARHHHAAPDDLAASAGTPQGQLAAAMAAAAAVGDYVCTPQKGQALDRLWKIAERHFDMLAEDVDDFLCRVDDRFKQAGDLFKVDMSDLGSPTDLMLEANEQLAQVALREHMASTQAAVRQQTVEAEMRVLESKNLQLQQQALHDALTKLYNRHFFDETLGKEYQRCIRTATPIGVIFADVDHFKQLNDTYGHRTGDAVLERIAGLFLETARTSDTVARYGGEEFVILVTQPNEKGLEKLAERIRERVAAEVFHSSGVTFQVTISLGAALTIPGRLEQETQKDLVAAADACLYESKEGGRNRITVRSLLKNDERELQTLVSQLRFSRWLVARGILDAPAIARAMQECPPQSLRLGDLALQMNFLSSEQVDSVQETQRNNASRFGEIACQRGWLTPRQLAQLLAWQIEEPKQLAGVLIRTGVLSPERTAAALEEYQSHSVATTAALAAV